MLGRHTEAEKAFTTFVLTVHGEEAVRLNVSVELLARNQWGGIDHTPEMIAAFVQPNDPTVERLLKRAADVFHQHGRSAAPVL